MRETEVGNQLFCLLDDITILFLFNKEKITWLRIVSKRNTDYPLFCPLVIRLLQKLDHSPTFRNS